MNDLTLGERGDPGRRPAREGTAFSATKCGTLISRRGRPKNPLVARLMAEGSPDAPLSAASRRSIKPGWQSLLVQATAGTPSTSTPTAITPRRHAAPGPCWRVNRSWAWSGSAPAVMAQSVASSRPRDLMSSAPTSSTGYGRGGHDLLADNTTLADHIVTNPPYGPARGLAAKFVAHALTRIRPGGTVCMLLRTNWEAPQAHQHLMARCCRKYTFSRRLKMHRDGYTGRKNSRSWTYPGTCSATSMRVRRRQRCCRPIAATRQPSSTR
jgi:hypothetical protein